MLENVLNRLLHTVEVGHLIEHAAHATLGAGAIVAEYVKDQGVVELADGFDSFDQPSDFDVGIFGKTGEHFHLPGEQLPFIVVQGNPSP